MSKTETTPDPTIVDWLLLKEAVDEAEGENDDAMPEKYAPAYERLYNQACKQAVALSRIAKEIHYPECWDTAAYPTLLDAIYEAMPTKGCSECQSKQ